MMIRQGHAPQACAQFGPLWWIAFLVLLVPSVSRADSVVVFNEVMYHPAGDESTGEWVELYNQMAVDIDLSWWSLAGGVSYTFAEGTVIKGGQFLVVAIAPDALKAVSGFADVLGPFDGRLSNAGERLELRNNNDRLMDWIDYDDQGVWPLGADGIGVSLAKRDPDTASPDPANWQTSLASGGTPGAHNFVDPDAPQYTVLLPVDATWRYHATGESPPRAWLTVGFNDRDWNTARALFFRREDTLPVDWTGSANRSSVGGPTTRQERRPFGVSRNAPPLARTEVSQGSTTAYFRATFDVDGAQEARELFFQPVVEDGAVIYLNGVEILRHNLPTGILDAETPALNAQGVPFAAPPIRLPVDLLRQGTNLLSAEVHVASEGPGDLTFTGWVFAQPTPPASLPQMRLMLSELPGVNETSFWTELFRAETPFWIELFNAGNTTIPLDGLMLRRGASLDTSYTITAPELPPGGYLVLNDANLSRPGSAGVFGVPGVALGIIVAFGGFVALTIGSRFGIAIVTPQRIGGTLLLGFVTGLMAHSALAGDATFGAREGDKLFLLSSDAARVVDAAIVQRVAQARDPNASLAWRMPAALTPGNPNRIASQKQIVINEIMYHPHPLAASEGSSNSSDADATEPGSWIELYNAGRETVDLAGWSLVEGVEFSFAPGTMLAPGEFLVVAEQADVLQRWYPDILVAGEFDRDLSNRSDRIVLVDEIGNTSDEVRYFDSGYWHALADGGGSSLELRDPRSDNTRPESWAASDESTQSGWHAYSYHGVARPVIPGDDGGSELLLGFLDGAGQVLIDDLSIVEDPDGSAREFVPDGDFESGSLNGWRFSGNHGGEVILDPEDAGNHVLKLLSSGPTEYVFNHSRKTLLGGATEGTTYALSYRAKWLAGSNLLNTRLDFNRLPRTTRLEVSARAGTPGRHNSQFDNNVGPTFSHLRHFPITPHAGQPVTVTAAIADPDGVAGATLWWAVNEGTWRSVEMASDANGRYIGAIPGQSATSIVHFYVAATDRDGLRAFGPAAGRESRALYAVDIPETTLDSVHALRTIMLPSEATALYAESAQSNARTGGTAVWNDRRAYYDVGIRLRASVRSGRSNPQVGLNLRFQPDALFRGIHRTVSIDRDSPLRLSVAEILVLHAINHAGGIPGMYNDIVQSIAPLPAYTSRAMLRMAGQSDVFLDTQFENGSDGTIFESERLFSDMDFMDLGDDKESYRWKYGIQNNRTRDDYAALMALCKTLGMPPGAELEARAAEIMDVNQWMRVFAMQTVAGVGDTYPRNGNKNLRTYVRPSDGRVLVFPWDMDNLFNSVPLSTPNEGNLLKVIERSPYLRMYYWHMQDIITTTFNTDYMTRWIRHYGDLANEDFDYVLRFIDNRVRAARDILTNGTSFGTMSEAPGASSLRLSPKVPLATTSPRRPSSLHR